MAKRLTIDTVIRGIEVTVTGEDFDGDPSVGIEYGPETVYATDGEGKDFELTEEELEKFTIELSKRYHEDWIDYE